MASDDFRFHGSNSAMQFIGWSAMRASTSRRTTSRLRPLSLRCRAGYRALQRVPRRRRCLRTGSSCVPARRSATRVRRRCCRSRCGHPRKSGTAPTSNGAPRRWLWQAPDQRGAHRRVSLTEKHRMVKITLHAAASILVIAREQGVRCMSLHRWKAFYRAGKLNAELTPPVRVQRLQAQRFFQ